MTNMQRAKTSIFLLHYLIEVAKLPDDCPAAESLRDLFDDLFQKLSDDEYLECQEYSEQLYIENERLQTSEIRRRP